MSLAGEYRTSASPNFIYGVSYVETGRTGSNATYRVSVKIRMGSSASYYGYGLTGYVKINGTSREIRIKNPSPTWSGSGWQGTWNFDITASAGTGGGTLPAEFKFWGTDGGSAPNITITGKTVRLSTWNTAPVMSGYMTAREYNSSGRIISNEAEGTENTLKFAENIDRVWVYWPAATDREGGTITYELFSQVNDGGWSKIYTGTGREFTHNIGSGNEGRSYDYYVEAIDSYGLRSNACNIRQFQKNSMTGANLTGGTSITYDTANITFNWSGASNTNGNGSFTYEISVDGITIYNASSLTTNGITLPILKGSNTSTSPYLKFDDIKNKFKSNGYRGTLTFKLTTKNAYGSSRTTTLNANVDLRTNPVAPTTITTGGRITVNGTAYYIPNKGDVSVSWSGASDKLGGTLTYDILGGYTTSSLSTLASSLTGTSASIKVPISTSLKDYYIRVVAKTSYGYTAYKDAAKIQLHYYSNPTINVGEITRAETTAKIPVTLTSNTTITGLAFTAKYTGSFSGNLSNTTALQNISLSGLLGEKTYSITITCVDNSGLGSTVSKAVNISANIPILSVRQNGVGVNSIAPTGTKFSVNGKSQLSGDVAITGALTTNGATQLKSTVTTTGKVTMNGGAFVKGNFNVNSGIINRGNDFNTYLTGGEYMVGVTDGPAQNQPTSDPNIYGKLVVIVSDGETHNNSNNWIWQIFYCTDGYTYRRFKVNAGAWQHWVRDLKQQRRLHSGDGSSANNFAGGQTFCYANVPGAPTFSGPMISFGGLDGKYDCQIMANYTEGGNQIAFRTRDGDVETWNPWRYLVTCEFLNTYWGMRNPDGDSGWIRTTQTGLIPYTSGGNSSSLGSKGWPFNHIYGKTLHADTYYLNTIDGDSAYLRIDTISQETRLDIVVADDENDKIRLINDHWNDRNKLLIVTCKEWTEVYNNLYTYGSNVPDGNSVSGWHLGWSGNRWDTLYATRSPNISSDRNKKENIVYLDEAPRTLDLKEYSFKNFFKKEFRPAMYNYKIVPPPNKSHDGEDLSEYATPRIYKFNEDELGFIAQDVIDTSVGQTFVYEDDNGELSYSLGGFTTAIAKGLQEEIESRDLEIQGLNNKINKLEEKIVELEKKFLELENFLQVEPLSKGEKNNDGNKGK